MKKVIVKERCSTTFGLVFLVENKVDERYQVGEMIYTDEGVFQIIGIRMPTTPAKGNIVGLVVEDKKGHFDLKKELDLIDAVIADYQKNNYTDKVCLYCGEKMQMETYNSFYEVKCPKGCITETFRGI